MKVIHIVDEFSQSNHGILEAAVSTSNDLSNSGVTSEVWFPKTTSTHLFDFRGATPISLASTKLRDLGSKFCDSQKHFEKTIVISHGAWRYATRLAWQANRLGCKWIYTPHGMLEPWSMQQKWLQKKFYWHFFEHRFIRRANVIRATSVPEYKNLSSIFTTTQLLSNGIAVPGDRQHDLSQKKRVLFLGRLHHKKAPVELVEAWLASSLRHNQDFELIIIGNDDGELGKLKSLLDNTRANVQLRAPVYGDEKRKLFDSCSFFALPSHSEGFPVALLEAMAAGLVPLISDGCNLPDAFSEGVAIRLTPVPTDITKVLESVVLLSNQQIASMSDAAQKFVRERYSVESMASQQLKLIHSL